MKENKSNFFTLAGYINQEMVLQELFHANEFVLANYSKNRKKLKILITKIFYSLIFGILPVIPLMGYFEMKQSILAEGVPLGMIVIAGSLLFVFFFALELLNVFFMGMIEVSSILYNPLFEWLKTLPLSDKKLTRLKLYSLFRNFDLPIIVMIFAFPIVMFIGTLNFIVLLICLGISIIQVILSFSMLILFGNRMNRILNINKLNSRKTMVFRLVNTFGYLIIFFVSLFFVQWAMTSVDTFFRFQMIQRNPSILILILSTIPYPFSPSYFITFLTTMDQLHFHYWIGTFCGFGLFLIFTYSVTRKALKDLARLSSNKGNDKEENEKLSQIEKDVQIKIKIRKPVSAHFFKDLSITLRNLKVFLSAITPIITSFVFTYTFNSTLLQNQTPLDQDFVYNLYVILAFQPIIGGMLIYNLGNIEVGEEAVLTTLPINSKNQAKAKLLYFTIIQTISVVSPYLIYIFDPDFFELLLTVFISLPFSWVVLLSMFEMYVYLFGRKKYRFTLYQVNPENKAMKWAFIYIAEYLFYFFITSVSLILFFRGVEYLIFTLTVFLIFCFFVLYFSFNSMFSSTLSPKKKKKISKKTNNKFKEDNYPQIKSNLSSFLMNNPGSSIFLLMSFSIFIIGLENIFLNFLKRYVINLRSIFFWLIILSTIIAFITMNRLIKNDNGNAYPESKNRFTKLKGIKTGIIGGFFITLLYFLFVFPFSLTLIQNLDFDLFEILTNTIIAIWLEILFRGTMHPILLAKYNKRVSLLLNSCITSLVYFLFFMNISLIIEVHPALILIALCLIFIINLILTYIFTKEKSIYSTLIFHIITSFTGVLPFLYFGIYMIFPAVYI